MPPTLFVLPEFRRNFVEQSQSVQLQFKNLRRIQLLTITLAAFCNLHDKLSKQPPEIAARLSRKEERTRVRFGKQRPGDQVFEHEGRLVLFMDKSMSKRLQHKVLDVRNTTEGTKLGLRCERKGPTAS